MQGKRDITHPKPRDRGLRLRVCFPFQILYSKFSPPHFYTVPGLPNSPGSSINTASFCTTTLERIERFNLSFD